MSKLFPVSENKTPILAYGTIGSKVIGGGRLVMSSKSQEDNRYRIRAIDRAMTVLSAFDMECSEMSIGEIAQRVGIPKSTVHRIVMSLGEWNVIEQNPVSGKYALGLKLFELGSVVLSQMNLRKEALPFLKRLSDEVGMTVHLVVRDGSHAIYIEKIEPPESIVHYSRVGKRLPLYCTAVGKVLLADLNREKIEGLLGYDLPSKTPNALTDIDELINYLKKVQADGYAIDNEELELGLKCLGCPLFNHLGRVAGAISLSASPTKMDDKLTEDLVETVKKTANMISYRLGFRGKAENYNWTGR